MSPADGKTGAWLAALLAALLGAVAYVNALENPFVYDDIREVVQNPSIGDLDLLAIFRHYPTRPLTNLTYAVDFAIGGLNPFVFHVTSVALHVLNVLLLFALVRGLVIDSERVSSTGARDAILIAFSAASLFAVHPALTQAVGYVSGRAELLAATLGLASMLCFRLAAVSRRQVYLAAGTAFFVLALGAKETAVMLPVLWLAYDRLVVPRAAGGRWNGLARFYAPLLAAAFLFGVVRMWRYLGVEQSEHAEFLWRNLLLEVHVFQRYVWLLFVPVGQSIVPAIGNVESFLDARLVSAAVLIGLIVRAGVATRPRQPLILFGIIWFYLMLLPSAALIVIADRGEPMAEHRVYFASCGFFMACAASFSLVLRRDAPQIQARRTAVIAVLCIPLAALMVLTIARNRVWSDPVTLWEDAARKAPATWLAQYGVAEAYRAQADCESATAAYRRAIALRPENGGAYIGLAQCLVAMFQLTDARDTLRQGIDHAPGDVRVMLALATLEERLLHRPDEALRLCQEALTLVPDSPQARDCVRRLGRGPAE